LPRFPATVHPWTKLKTTWALQQAGRTNGFHIDLQKSDRKAHKLTKSHSAVTSKIMCYSANRNLLCLLIDWCA